MQARAFIENKYYLLVYKRFLMSYADASYSLIKH